MRATALSHAPHETGSTLARGDDFTQREPIKAVATAAGLGFLLSFLPVGAILGRLIGASLVLVRPGLLLLGFLKAAEHFAASPSPSQKL
jgi:hypothetical protein